MRNVFVALLGVCLAFGLQAQDSEKTLVKTLNPEEAANVQIDIKNKGMESAPWDQGTIRIQLAVEANVPEAILTQLVKAGRYSLDGNKDGEIYIVSAPNLDKAITIGGKDLEEKITVMVQTPGYFALNDAGMLSKDINEEVIAGRTLTDAEAKALIKKMRAIQEDVVWDIQIKSTLRKQPELDLSTVKMTIDGKEVMADELSF